MYVDCYLRIPFPMQGPDIIVESWLDDTVLDSEVSIQGYTPCRLDHSRHGGGVMIFV